MVIGEPTEFRLYIESNINLTAAIKKGTGKQSFKRARLGGKCIFAFDQATRLFAIFHGLEV